MMLPDEKKSRNTWFPSTILLVLLMIFIAPAFAQDAPPSVTTLSASGIIDNISKQIPNLMRLVTAIAYVMGIFFMYIGIMQLKMFGMGRSMMSMEHHLTGPIVTIAVGALLIYLPTAVQIGLSTFWTNPNPYGYVSNEDQWSKFMNNIYLIVQLFGVIAFIRGLVMLTKLGQRSGGQNVLGAALMHIIGGIFCINIYQFIQVVLVTLGIQT